MEGKASDFALSSNDMLRAVCVMGCLITKREAAGGRAARNQENEALMGKNERSYSYQEFVPRWGGEYLETAHRGNHQTKARTKGASRRNNFSTSELTL